MRKIVLLFICSLLIFSCKKYPEGPGFSLKSKKSRITGEWLLKSFDDNDFIFEEYGWFNYSVWGCSIDTSIYESNVTKTDVIWEIEGDNDFKEKYFRHSKRLSYGMTSSNCEITYVTEDSTEVVDVKKWGFSNKKSEFQILIGSTIKELEIVRLTNSELKLKDDFGKYYVLEKIK